MGNPPWRRLVRARIFAAVHNEWCESAWSRGFEHPARGFYAIAEPRKPRLPHARSVLGKVALPRGAILQSVLHADDPPPVGRWRFDVRQDFHTDEARQRQHFADVFIQPRRVFPTQRHIHFELDDVQDHAPVKLINTANTEPNPIMIR